MMDTETRKTMFKLLYADLQRYSPRKLYMLADKYGFPRFHNLDKLRARIARRHADMAIRSVANFNGEHDFTYLNETVGGDFDVVARILRNAEMAENEPDKWSCGNDNDGDDDNDGGDNDYNDGGDDNDGGDNNFNDFKNTYLREKSKQLFKHISSWEEFAAVWSLFYTGDICISTYGYSFIHNFNRQMFDTDSATDFYNFCSYGLIAVDSQNGSAQSPSQRAYISFNVKDKDIARILHEELNRHYDIVAIINTSGDTGDIRFPYVTYHGEEMVGAPDGIVMGGEAFSKAFTAVESSVNKYMLRDCNVPSFLKKQVGITIFDPDYRRNTLRKRLLDILKTMWLYGQIKKYDLGAMRKTVLDRINRN